MAYAFFLAAVESAAFFLRLVLLCAAVFVAGFEASAAFAAALSAVAASFLALEAALSAVFASAVAFDAAWSAVFAAAAAVAAGFFDVVSFFAWACAFVPSTRSAAAAMREMRFMGQLLRKGAGFAMIVPVDP